MNTQTSVVKKRFLMSAGIAVAVLAALIFCLPHPTEAARSGEKLVTIHDNYATNEQTIVTTAGTVRDALAKAKVQVSSLDRVEPSLNTPLNDGTYNVNIYHARPVTIVDGINRTSIVTAYQSAVDIARAANLTVYPEDQLELSQINDFVTDNAMGLMLTVHRATPFTLVMYGHPTPAHTMAKTVNDMLSSKGVKLATNDGTSVPLATPITAGMIVEVWRNGVQTQTVEAPIPFTIRQIEAPDQPVGYKQIQTPGVNGTQLVTYQINLQNGKEISRTQIQAIVTIPMSEQVEIVGTKLVLPPGSHQDWMSAANVSPNDFGYINYIFSHESGWTPSSVSRNGYVGLGQTSKTSLSNACPNWQVDPVCQIQFFSGYANRYGGWAGAAKTWSRQGWW